MVSLQLEFFTALMVWMENNFLPKHETKKGSDLKKSEPFLLRINQPN